ncbi:uncharacterized protein LOC111379852 [Olea europaea var. sylvestris]|uniref:uncharacterized protein LOC111379852 n=1 Tax=Olea europaea var. sylvestris TaxID=158386 RepID=UPI000C1D1179|nr:uncharacterized protein LOC111379852 [Olea europaea var. sylvestris]
MENETTLATIKLMNQDLVWLDWFDGTNYTRWKDKLKFPLTALKIFYILDPDLASLSEPTNEETETVRNERQKRQEDELICHGHILNALSDRLYDLYTNTTSAKEIWEALENKYKPKEEGYRKKIMHSSKDYSLKQLQKYLRIEEESRMRDKNDSHEGTSKVNAVEKFEPPKSNKRKPSKNINKFKKKTKGGCFVCEKSGHYAKDCRHRKHNTSEGNVNSIQNERIVATVSEINAIKGKAPD